MMTIAILVVFFCLTAIVYQDLKYRHIHIVWPAGLFIAAIYTIISKFTNKDAYVITAYNSGFFLFVFLVLFIYMSIKNRQMLNPFKNYFGLGDLLFYLSISPLFLLNNYVLFFVLSMVFSIIVFTLFRKMLSTKSIPLAGYASILLIVFLGKDLLFNYYSITLIK